MKNNSPAALHVNSYFLSNSIHYQFLKTIKSRRPKDKFLIPVYKKFREKDIPSIKIDYVFDGFDKTVFVTKIPKVLWLFYKKKFEGFDYLHGHTLISDGIPTYLLSRFKKKKYVVSVRSTDINLFLKRSKIFRAIGFHILKNAEAVFFISPSLISKLVNIYPQIEKDKFFLLPNGLDNFWINAQQPVQRVLNPIESVKLLFVGELIPRKNLTVLIEFLKRRHKIKYTLTVVGKNTDNVDFDNINSSLADGNLVRYLGEIKDKEELKNIYDSNDVFLLLSKSETFGVVYIEAISRGLPIIYSKGEGMDGFFENGEVGFSCDKESVEELEKAINLILLNYSEISSNAHDRFRTFDWELIIDKYIQQIDSILLS